MSAGKSQASALTQRARFAICAALGVGWGLFIWGFVKFSGRHQDFGQLWFAGRALLKGQNPYDVIGVGKPFEWFWPWYYPLPAAFVGMVFAPFSEQAAIGLFSGLSATAFAWALTEQGFAPLLAFLSTCTWLALARGQGAPLLASALVLTPLSVLLVAKPTIGAAIFVARPSWWAVGGGLALLLAAFLVQPHWPADWIAALNSPAVAPGFRAPHRPPISFPGGLLVLAALCRWRRVEARLLIAMACVPQTTMPHEVVPLFLVARGWIESGLLLALSQAMIAWVVHFHAPTLAEGISAYGPAFVWFMYLPCLVMVLRRPNEGTVPKWIERRIEGWPAWLRGRPEAA